MTKSLSLIAVLLAAAAGCSHPQQCPAAVSATPPSLTSAPVPSNMPPPPPPSHGVAERGHVWRLDFVLTPKDAKDATLAPTTFTINIPDHQSGEIMVGKNVPLQVSGPPVPATGGSAAAPHLMTPRQDVGLKVKAHIQPFANGGDDFLMDVDLELSAVDSGTPVSSIRKLTARGAAVAMGGKSSMIVSLDDDKWHYELTVTPTKLR
jgi:hypothetical protein